MAGQTTTCSDEATNQNDSRKTPLVVTTAKMRTYAPGHLRYVLHLPKGTLSTEIA